MVGRVEVSPEYIDLSRCLLLCHSTFLVPHIRSNTSLVYFAHVDFLLTETISGGKDIIFRNISIVYYYLKMNILTIRKIL